MDVVAAAHSVTLVNAGLITTIGLSTLTLLGLVYRVAKRVENAIGKDEAGRTLNQRTDRIEHQLWPNGGASLADTVNRLERNQIEIHAETRLLRNLMTGVLGKGNSDQS